MTQPIKILLKVVKSDKEVFYWFKSNLSLDHAGFVWVNEQG